THPAVMLVNGATDRGNDGSETRRLAEALARGGYLVMLPEFPFIKGGVLERDAARYIDGAFARLLARPDARPGASGAFGFSVGGGLLLAAASRPGALRDARYLGALGAYFDLDTYLASVLAGAQRRNGNLEPWDVDPEVRLRLPVAAAEALADPGDRGRAATRRTDAPAAHRAAVARGRARRGGARKGPGLLVHRAYRALIVRHRNALRGRLKRVSARVDFVKCACRRS